MSKSNIEDKMSAIGLKRNKIEKLKIFIDQNNSSKNLRFHFGSNSVDFKDGDFENGLLNEIAQKLITQLESEIEFLD